MRATIAVRSLSALALAAILSGCVVRAEPVPVYYEPAPVYHAKRVKIPAASGTRIARRATNRRQEIVTP
jgi:hypothetical protein